MQIFKTDTLIIDKVGAPGGEAYLVRTPERTLLFDSGFAYSAPAMVQEIEALLTGRPLDYQFLSHSHYDHASGSVWVKQRWPEVIILGSPHAARVLTRPGARETIHRLNLSAANDAVFYGHASSETVSHLDFSLLDSLGVDEAVTEGSCIDLGCVLLEVIEAPGHTRCSLMLWCVEERLLFGSESLGVMVNENMVCPAYLTGYHDSLESIAKAQALQAAHILVNHQEVVSNAAAAQYLKNARHWAEKTAHLVWECRSIGMDKTGIVAMLKEIFYSEDLRGSLPEAAFDLNNNLVVDQLLASMDAPAKKA